MLNDSVSAGDLARLPIAQAAAAAGLTQQLLRRAVRSGQLRHVWVGRHRRPMTTQTWVTEWHTRECR